MVQSEIFHLREGSLNLYLKSVPLSFVKSTLGFVKKIFDILGFHFACDERTGIFRNEKTKIRPENDDLERWPTFSHDLSPMTESLKKPTNSSRHRNYKST